MKKFYILYKITNIVNGMIYIGVHNTNNIEDGYMGSGRYLKSAIRKEGKHNFIKDIICLCSCYEEMYGLEYQLVDKSFIQREDTYNLIIGGQMGYEITQETRDKQSKAKKGYVPWNKGKHPTTQETKDKQSKAKKGKSPANKGKHPSQETKDKQSKAKINNPTRYWLGKKRVEYGIKHAENMRGRLMYYNPETKIRKLIKPGDFEKYESVGWKRIIYSRSSG